MCIEDITTSYILECLVGQENTQDKLSSRVLEQIPPVRVYMPNALSLEL
jgi:hypothetical protein